MKIEVLYHSSIRFTTKDKVIYFDPYEIKGASKDADIIFITHSHTDHYSKKDIKKLIQSRPSQKLWRTRWNCTSIQNREIRESFRLLQVIHRIQ